VIFGVDLYLDLLLICHPPPNRKKGPCKETTIDGVRNLQLM